MNCPENQQFKKNPVGDGSFRGSKDQKSGKFHELPRKSIHFFNPLRGWREGGVDGREKGRGRQAGKEGPEQKPGNQLVVKKMCG